MQNIWQTNYRTISEQILNMSQQTQVLENRMQPFNIHSVETGTLEVSVQGKEQTFILPETEKLIYAAAEKGNVINNHIVEMLSPGNILKETIKNEIETQVSEQEQERVLIYQKHFREEKEEKEKQKSVRQEGIVSVSREDMEIGRIAEKQQRVSIEELELRLEKQEGQISQLLKLQKELLAQLNSKETQGEASRKAFRRYEERISVERMRYGL